MVRPRGRNRKSTAKTKLARVRLARGVSQDELAAAVGTSPSTYRRLEHDQLTDVPLQLLSNCALALGVTLEDLIEDHWREWLVLDSRRPAPPEPSELWRTAEQELDWG